MIEVKVLLASVIVSNTKQIADSHITILFFITCNLINDRLIYYLDLQFFVKMPPAKHMAMLITATNQSFSHWVQVQVSCGLPLCRGNLFELLH